MRTAAKEKDHGHRGIQRLYVFDNGYGASVICGPYSYGGDRGKWELAVTISKKDDDWNLCYDTPITDDVIGYLSEDEVDALLDQIEALPKREKV